MFAFQPQPDVQGDPQIAVSVEFRTVRVFMVMSCYSPTFGHGQVFVGRAVSIGVGDASEFTALRCVKRSIVFEQSQRFVKCRRKLVINNVCRRIGVHVIQEPNFAFANRNSHAVVVHHLQPTHFQREIIRRWFPVGRS